MKQLAIGLAMTAVLAGCSGSTADGPAAAAEVFMKKINTGDCNGLRDDISASGRDILGPTMERACGTVKSQLDQNPELAKQGIKQIHVVENKEEGDKATVKFEPERNDGQRGGTGTLVMVKEDGRWKVDLFASVQAMTAGNGGLGGLGGMGANPGRPAPAPAPPAATPAPAPAK
jgi:hypothetical protein